eukprot:s676_g5.t1
MVLACQCGHEKGDLICHWGEASSEEEREVQRLLQAYAEGPATTHRRVATGDERYWGHGRQVALLLGPPEKDWSDAVSEPGFLEALAHNDNFHTYSIAIQDGWIVWMMPFVSLYLTGFSFNARVPIDEVHFKVFCSEDGIDWKLCLDSKEHGNIEEDEDVCCEHRHVKWLKLLVVDGRFSTDFCDQLFQFAATCKRPCLMLVPNFTIEAASFDKFDEKSLLFLGPLKRYSYRSPANLRPELGNKQRKYVAPYVTLWVLLLGPSIRKALMRSGLEAVCPSHCVLVPRRDALPPALRGTAKASGEALERKAFNDFCRARNLGKLCFDWAKQGSCGCAAAKPKVRCFAAKGPGGGRNLKQWCQTPASTMKMLQELKMAKRPDLIYQLLEALEVEGRLQLSPAHLTVGITTCSGAGDWERALALFASMPKHGISPDTISFSAALSACEKGRQWQMALALFESMQRQEIAPNVITFSAVISACEKGMQWPVALHLFHALPQAQVAPNIISYSAAISSCEKGHQWQFAVSLLRSMPRVKIRPTVVSYSAAMSSCEKGGQWELAMQLFHTMSNSHIHPDVIACSAAIRACERAEQWVLALKLLSIMPALTISPNVVSYSAAITCCKHGTQWQLAVHLLGTMPKDHKPSHIISYNATIGACGKAGHWQLALTLIGGMGKVSLPANAMSYGATIGACTASGQWQAALCMFTAMQLGAQILPDIADFQAVVSACDQSSQRAWALELLRKENSSSLCFKRALSSIPAGQGRFARFAACFSSSSRAKLSQTRFRRHKAKMLFTPSSQRRAGEEKNPATKK